MTQFVNVSFFCVPVHEDTTATGLSLSWVLHLSVWELLDQSLSEEEQKQTTQDILFTFTELKMNQRADSCNQICACNQLSILFWQESRLRNLTKNNLNKNIGIV